ncbi:MULTISPECIES: extracellular solute-binding protein [Streptomyces violaceusniger group]|uniref:Extracellular solute-binding protein n=2 Tax=Streptomyces rhizosphaericus TaxID=114699 RepID=A0ABP4BMN0_9ACTN|nr:MULTISPECIES: extracellular solute-binding protein [Streptomyces violaceusniger group]
MRRNGRLGKALVLAVLLGLTMTACFGTAGSSAGGGKPVVFSNTGGALEKLFKQNAYADLSRKGITVSTESPNNEAKLTAMVRGSKPTWDVYYSTPYAAMAKCGTLFEKIDYSRIHTGGLDKSQMTDCGVPVLNSYFVLVYNKDTYKSHPPRSWADFYDTKKFPGTRGVMNFAKDAGMETALLAGGVPADKLYPLDYDKAFATLDKIRKNTRFYDTGAQQTQALQSGEVDMMLAWPGRAYDAVKNGANLGVVFNQPIKYHDVLTIVKGAPHQDQAYALINSLIGTKNQKAVVDQQPYGAANSKAGKTSDAAIGAFVADDTKAKGTVVVRDNAWWAKNLDEATRRWTKWVNG